MIVPNSASPLLMVNSGDPLDEYGKIERSIRLRRASSSYLKFTPPTPSTCQKITFSFWVKRGELSLFQSIFGGGSISSGYVGDYFGFAADDTFFLCFDDSINGSAAITYTAGKYRDPGAHLHVVLGFDSTQAIQANRVALEINGVATSINNNLSLNAALYFMYSATATPTIGVRNSTTHIDNPFGGVLSHFACIVGQKLTASSFGLFHPRTGQWRPKSKAAIRAAVAENGGTRNGWGANGFFLPFDDTSSVAALGYDRSQSDTDTSGNNWTPANVSLTAGATYDSMLDTPTNNFATLNQNDANGVSGDCGLRWSGNLAFVGIGRATIPMTSGKWYFEFSVVSGSSTMAGISSAAALLGQFLGQNANGWAYEQQTGNKYTGGAATAYGSAFAAGDIVGVGFDADTGNLTFYKNGVSQGIAYAGLTSGPYFFTMCDSSGSLTMDATVNFGQQSFSYLPSGYKALNTKNLPFPKIKNPKSAFVAVTDTGANISATLANERAGWAAYIDIIKRRDAAEGWRWIFSDDSTNYLDSSSTAAKAAVPAFSGTAYVGYSLKVSALTGVATGRLTHISGVADVVADGLSNSRKMVILKNESTGNWFVYHPDLTAGKLIYLNLQNAETTDASINNVTASGFTVASALASGTYRWIALAEVDGFLKLFKYTGNASTGGPFSNCSHLPSFFMLKNKDAVQTWLEWDNVRETKNPEVTQIYPNQTAAELIDSSNNLCDFVSQGIKYRGASSPGNGSGNTIVGLSFAAFPFRYANAR